MARQTWETLINAYQWSGENSGTELASTETEKAITPGGKEAKEGALVIPANFLGTSMILRFNAKGWFTTAATPGKLKFVLYAGTTALATSFEATPEKSLTETLWEACITSRIVTTKGESKVITAGFIHGIGTGASGASASVPIPSSKQTEVAIKTESAVEIYMSAKWSNAEANKLLCTQWMVELLN